MAGDDRSRWTDERLDDNVGIIHDELRAMRELPRSMADLSLKVEQMGKELDSCYDSVRNVSSELAEYIKEERARREKEDEKAEELQEKRRLERKSDRRWLVGVGMTSASIVIAALGLIAGKF